MDEDLSVRNFCSLHLRKAGNTEDEYEDAYAARAETRRFAVADGATDSSFANRWAKQLVDGFVARPWDETCRWSNWLPSLQKQWADEIDAKNLPHFAQNKAQKGAFATFLGLVFEEKRWLHNHKVLHWRVLAVGDACLFLIRDNKCQQRFPIKKAEDFDNSPFLIGSRPAFSRSLPHNEMRQEGSCSKGDVFWMMTDALSQWFLKELDADRKPWKKLEPYLFGSPSEARFSAWLEELRGAKEIRNDDVTMMGIAF
jgi:hypothetical protein